MASTVWNSKRNQLRPQWVGNLFCHENSTRDSIFLKTLSLSRQPFLKVACKHGVLFLIDSTSLFSNKLVAPSCRVSSLDDLVVSNFMFVCLGLGWPSCLSFWFFRFLRLNLWSLYAKKALYHWGTSPVRFWLFLSRQVLLSFPGSPWKQQVLNLQSPWWWEQKTETSQWDWDSKQKPWKRSCWS